jgi:hypothetical protein
MYRIVGPILMAMATLRPAAFPGGLVREGIRTRSLRLRVFALRHGNVRAKASRRLPNCPGNA